jgi:UDP:flavonoid glycosyltransferase YjiC (YdhE family)
VRALFTTQPTFSHWLPLVPLAKAVEAAGHEVAFATMPRFCPTIEAGGFRCFPAGADDTPEERRQRRAEMAGLNAQQDTHFTLQRVFAGVRAERTLPDLLEIVRDWPADVVVRENTELAGCIAAERAGIGHAVVQITANWSYFLDAVAAPVARLRASMGLPHEDTAQVLYRHLVLSPRPLSLWNPSVPIPPTTRAHRYASISQPGDEALPPWVAELDDRPTVYATLGTFDNERTDVLQGILAGLREEPLNLILTIGRNRDPAEFCKQPANVRVERFIPQTLLLPHCDLVLCHGGSGTMMDALGHGLPMVLIPIAADQPENAQRCEDLGVARVVQPDLGAELPHAIRDATREVLQDPRYRQAAQRLREEIDDLPGLDYAVKLLEALAAARN